MIGDGPCKDDLVAMVRGKGLSNVRLFPPRPKREIPAILASCDCSLIPLHKRMPGTMPSKVYEALAAGVPAIVAAEGELADFARDEEIALVVPPLDGRALAEAMVARGRERLKTMFRSWDDIAEQLATLLAETAQGA